MPWTRADSAPPLPGREAGSRSMLLTLVRRPRRRLVRSAEQVALRIRRASTRNGSIRELYGTLRVHALSLAGAERFRRRSVPLRATRTHCRMGGTAKQILLLVRRTSAVDRAGTELHRACVGRLLPGTGAVCLGRRRGTRLRDSRCTDAAKRGDENCERCATGTIHGMPPSTSVDLTNLHTERDGTGVARCRVASEREQQDRLVCVDVVGGVAGVARAP